MTNSLAYLFAPICLPLLLVASMGAGACGDSGHMVGRLLPGDDAGTTADGGGLASGSGGGGGAGGSVIGSGGASATGGSGGGGGRGGGAGTGTGGGGDNGGGAGGGIIASGGARATGGSGGTSTGACVARTPGVWQAMSTVNAPPAPVSLGNPLTVVWSGRELFVLMPVQAGGRYDPCLDQWTPIAAPSPSRAPVVVTDTGVFFVYSPGGVATGFSFFDFATAAYRELAIAGYPQVADVQGSAIWNGRVLVRWGGMESRGVPYDNLTNGGAVYDPAVDRWKAISTAGAPPAREIAGNVVRAGDRVAVWGGRVRGNIQGSPMPDDPAVKALLATPGLDCPDNEPLDCSFGTGAIYDPAADAWTAIAAAGAPRGRRGHFLGWTGTRLLVWGGAAFLPNPDVRYTNLVDGGLYDPVAARWTPTAPFPEAAIAVQATAVFANGRLIVTTSNATTPAYVYDPAQNQWQPAAAPPSGPAGNRAFDPVANSWTVLPARPDSPTSPVRLYGQPYFLEWGGFRLGPVPPNPCPTNPPIVGCDPAGPERVPTNEGAVLVP